ncbi:hypothetical protein K7432_005370 [Basidiobolus ranarum]|uniref:Uncharacterized protein n=1 Tax=Basidiobolus ranarum TaxID=34480 RepID=A0ABR2W398_9FUNG
MDEFATFDEYSRILKSYVIPGIICLLGDLLVRRLQIVPRNFTSWGLMKEYFYAILFPMDSIRNYITQYVEIKSTGGMQGHLESALRSAYAENGYWVNACPKNVNVTVIKRDTAFTEATSVTKAFTSLLHKHTMNIPSDCVLLTKIRKCDIPLILKHKVSVSQGRITKDDTTTTKVCALIVLLGCCYAVPTYLLITWNLTLSSVQHELYLTAFISNAIIFVPLFYTFGKCVAPVFVSLESDGPFLNTDFTLLSDSLRLNEEEGLDEWPKDTKESTERRVRIRYELERVIGSVVYLAMYLLLIFTTEQPTYRYIRGLTRMSYKSFEKPTLFPAVEAILHCVLCLITLGKLYFTSRRVLTGLQYIANIFSGVYCCIRVLFITLRIISLKY